jgi:NhaP-type Na+/H+ or K+/H+ antiporter
VAPTDPVLASDVQVDDEDDRDRLRFGLTAEAGLNDGAALPFLVLGLGTFGKEPAAPCFAGRVVGVRSNRRGCGPSPVCRGGVLLVTMAVAGSVLKRLPLTTGVLYLIVGVLLGERGFGLLEPDVLVPAHAAMQALMTVGNDEAAATDEKTAATFMARAILVFNEQLERIGEVVVVILIGSMLRFERFTPSAIIVGVALFLVARPLAVARTLGPAWGSSSQVGLISWFGVRGVGSLYYLAYAVTHGLGDGPAREVAHVVLAVLTASIFLHGLSVTPVMTWYGHRPRRDAFDEPMMAT